MRRKMMCWSIVKPRENRKKRNVIKLGLLKRNSSSFLILYFIVNSLYINLWLYKCIFPNNFPQTWTTDYFLRNWLIPLKITKKRAQSHPQKQVYKTSNDQINIWPLLGVQMVHSYASEQKMWRYIKFTKSSKMSMTLKWLKTTNRIQHQNEACIFNVTTVNSCLFNLYAEDSMQNAWLNESQAGIKIARRSINNFRYADDTTLMEESEEELKSTSWWGSKRRVGKAGLKLYIQKTNIMAYGPMANKQGKKWFRWWILYSRAQK